MSQKERILVINASSFISGAELSLSEIILKGFKNFEPIIILPRNKFPESHKNQDEKVYYLPLKWFCFTINIVKLIEFAYSLIITTYYLHKIIKKHNIKFLYANTVKAQVYAAFLNIFFKTKIILHFRDNIKSGIVYKWLIKRSDLVITVSKFIHNQIPLNDAKKKLVYTGIDTNYWTPNQIICKQSEIINRTIIVAQIGQITRWKNHFDFIKTASIITKSFENVKFYIVGGDLSGREKMYRQEIENLVSELKMGRFIFFLDHEEKIMDFFSHIDILLHPAINEPFGRVVIEAMAMEKPVVAYNSGGPKEIIINNKTGYLVKPHDIKSMAEKTCYLIKNEELRIKFGKEGRERVIENFSLNRYVKEMEAIFEQIK